MSDSGSEGRCFLYEPHRRPSARLLAMGLSRRLMQKLNRSTLYESLRMFSTESDTGSSRWIFWIDARKCTDRCAGGQWRRASRVSSRCCVQARICLDTRTSLKVCCLDTRVSLKAFCADTRVSLKVCCLDTRASLKVLCTEIRACL